MLRPSAPTVIPARLSRAAVSSIGSGAKLMARELLRRSYLSRTVLTAIADPIRVGRRDSVTRSLKHARFLAGALALVLGLTLAAPTAFAAGPATAASPRPIAAAAAAKVEAIPAATLAQAAPPAPATTDAGGKAFFKTPKGVAALVLTVGVAAWLIQSRSSDKVSSPARQ
jgi:hypothetical protein